MSRCDERVVFISGRWRNFRSGGKMAAPKREFPARERRFGEPEQEQDWDATAPKRPRLGAGSKSGGRRLIVVLEGASLETVKVVCDRKCLSWVRWGLE